MGMNARPFDLRDLPTLHRYRRQCLYLDSARLLTQGPQIFPVRAALLSYFPAAAGILTFRGREDGSSHRVLLGQAAHKAGSQSAHLIFLAPDNALDSPGLPHLLERMIVEIGERGAYNLLADVEEENPAFEALRRVGFAIYARQRIWQLTGDALYEPFETKWKNGSSSDIIGVRSLYNNLVPGLVQQVEPPPSKRLHGLTYKEKDEVLAYIELKYGPAGIWVQPFVHPDTGKVANRLAHLVQNIPNRKGRPVYFCVRSYQSWLESAIEDIGAEAGPRQAVLVKRLAILQKQERTIVVPNLERNQREASAPLTNTKSS